MMRYRFTLLLLALAAAGADQPFSYPLHPTDVIGVPDSTVGTLITPEGYLFTGWGELTFSIGSPLRPVNQRLRRLADGYLPVIEYSVDDHGVRFDFTTFAATLDGKPTSNPINFVRVLVRNTTREARRSGFAAGERYINSTDPRVAWRYRFKRPVSPDASVPYEKLPYHVRYYMDGEEYNPKWRYSFGEDYLARDGRALFLFSGAPGKNLARGVQPETVAGTVHYDLQLKPGERREIVLKVPTRPATPGELPAIRAASFEAVYQRTAQWWRALLRSGMEIELPEKKASDTFKASLAYCYLARDYINGDYRQTPGKLNYHAFYLRDSSVFSQAYDLTGNQGDASKILKCFLKWQQQDGNFVSDMWDGWGQTLWIFGEHAELNRDCAFAAQVYPAVVKAVQWLEDGLAKDPYGTFPAGPAVDAEYLTGRFGHVTGWNFLGLGGLRGAMKLARLLGKEEDIVRYQGIYDRWKAAFEKRLNAIAPRVGGRIPPGLDDPTGLDGSTWFNLNAIYPVEIFDPRDPRVSATLDWARGRYIEGVARWEGNDRVRAAGGPPRVHAYLTAMNTESALIRGEQEQALKEYYGMLAHTTSTHGASEQVMPGTRDPAGQPQPHGWFAANYVVLLRHMLIRERGDELHLLSAVSPEWLKPGAEIRVSRAPTRFGPLDLLVKREARRVTVELRPRFHTPPASIVVHIPWYLRESTSDGQAEMRLSPKDLRVEMLLVREPKLPLMNHETAVKDLLAEFERTKDYWNEYVKTGRKPTAGARPTDEILRLVDRREDMQPWAGRSSADLHAWLDRGVRFHCDDDALVSKFYYSKLVFLANQLHEGIYDRPYVIEGGVYRAFWFESVPVTMQVYARIDLETAKAQLRQFLKCQMPDGYVPYKIMSKGPGERSIGYGWLAFAAWHLYLLDGDRAFLESFYAPLGRWIEWMGKFRDANRNGIYEAWSPGDVGHDFSARFQGLPLHVDDLRIAPVGKPTPYDAPDVSGLMHLEMLSLGEIADVLGKPVDAKAWRRRAGALRDRVNRTLWDNATASYYDRDSKGQFVKMIGEVLLRSINCGLPTDEMARQAFERHILNPREFWTACPLPCFSLAEPLATPDKPDTWSGPTMGLTNLRAPYGFLHYGRGRELREVFRRFLAAVVRQPATYQQYHPLTGKGGAPKSVLLYSPTAAFVVDAVARLYGVVPRGRHLEWNLSLPAGSRSSRYEMDLGGRTYRLECAAGSCSGSLDGRRLFTGPMASIVYTDFSGRRVPQADVRDFPRLR